jgi:hypothetical protein
VHYKRARLTTIKNNKQGGDVAGMESSAHVRAIGNNFRILNYIPTPRIEDDLAAVHHHISYLQKESEKTSRDAVKVQNLMMRTFPHRRQEIVVKCIAVQKLIELYPLLFEKDQVSCVYVI